MWRLELGVRGGGDLSWWREVVEESCACGVSWWRLELVV